MCISVLGPVLPEALGKTLCHEHLSLQFDVAFCPSKTQPGRENLEFSLENLHWIRSNPLSVRKNLQVSGPEVESVVLRDVKAFKAAGGGAIVDCTTNGICRRADLLHRYAKESGVHIVAGAGFYVAPSQPETTLCRSVESMKKQIVEEVTIGTSEAPEVTCGIIGEIGTSFPLDDFERRSLQASAAAQVELGRPPANIHAGRDPSSPAESTRVFTEAGGDPRRLCMSHVERTFRSFDQLTEYADEFPVYVEVDLFGLEMLHYPLGQFDAMPSDRERVSLVKRCVEAGYTHRLLISHDVFSRHRLTGFGGHGYQHILENIVPCLKANGVSDAQIDAILVQNPAAFLAF